MTNYSNTLYSTVILAGALFSPLIFAAPIADRSVINILQFDTSGNTPEFLENSTASSFSNTFAGGNDVQAFGNLATGEVGTRVIGADGSFAQSIVAVFDTLDFTTPGDAITEVSFDLNFDASLASSSEFDNPRTDSFVRIYDITGLDSWLETSSGLFATTRAIDAATLISFEEVRFSLDDFPRNGTLFDFSASVSGSFMADPSKTYGIQVASSSFANPNSIADALNTGTLNFTDLGGATFTSESEVFLTQAAVPVPAAIWLFGSALLGLLGVRRNNQ